MHYPAELHEPSPRPYRGLTELQYPFHGRKIFKRHAVSRVCSAFVIALRSRLIALRKS
jgi:hypothetical protein